MREIKFRAWDKENKEMADVVEIVFDQYGGVDVRTSRRMGINASALGNDSLMQYTGLKDKNGKEIYEGDIIKWVTGECAVVEWSDGDAEFLCEIDIHKYQGCVGVGGFDEKPILNGFSSTMARHYEVIGNIYENPELLNNK